MIPVIIPSYRRQDQLRKCLEHLSRQTIPVEVFIHENTRDNIYYTAAINKGIRKYLDKDCDYIVTLNQDMYMQPDAIEKIVLFMDSHPQCGIASPLQVHSDNPGYAIWGGGYEAFPAGRHKHGHLSEFESDEQVLWCNGSCMVLRKRMIEEIGLFDENMLFLGSDSDYCFTARSRNWQVWRVGSAKGTHEYGASGAGTDPGMEAIKASDMLYFGRKWLTGELYRSLAYEGSECTPATVTQMMADLESVRGELIKAQLHHIDAGDKPRETAAASQVSESNIVELKPDRSTSHYGEILLRPDSARS